MRFWLAAVLFIGFAFGCVSGCCAQGTRPMGMGGAFVAVADDVNALTFNPAGIARLKSPEVALSSMRHDGDNLSLSATGFGIVLPCSRSSWSFGVSTVHTTRKYDGFFDEFDGFDYEYSTDDYGVAVAYRLSPKTSVAASVSVTELSLSRSGTNTYVDLSALHMIDEKWSVGLLVQNINSPGRSYYDSYDYELPCIITPGIAYRPNKNTLLALDVYDQDGRLVHVFGVEHILANGIALRVGTSGMEGYGRTSFGIGKAFGKVRVDAAVASDEFDDMTMLSLSSKF